MARIPSTPSPSTFAEVWSSDLGKAAKDAAGKDGRLSKSEAQKLAAKTDDTHVFGDNAVNYLAATGKQSVSPAVLTESAQAYALRAAQTAAGTDGKLSLVDGAKLPADLREDFFMLRGKTTTGTTTGSALPQVQAALEAAATGMTMPSETDASFKFLSGRPLNGAPITAQTVRDQLTAQHDALLPQVMYVSPGRESLAGKTTVEERDFNDFMDRISNNMDPNDPQSVALGQRFVALKAAMNSQLTDLKVFRFGTIDISTFLVGRTHTGELAGLLTGQVET